MAVYVALITFIKYFNKIFVMYLFHTNCGCVIFLAGWNSEEY